MRYRKLDANGDYSFGHGMQDFWINQPEAVAQWCLTRLWLNQGEWFADTSDGTPWKTEVLGERTRFTRDMVVRERVATTPGVTEITRYASSLDVNTRAWAAAMTVDTVYGAVALASARLPGSVPDPIVFGQRAELLGIVGPGVARMTPANLLVGPRSDVTDFAISAIESGTF